MTETSHAVGARTRRHGLRTSVSLGITVAIVYAIHFAPNVVRETYLAVSIGERLSIRVDPYLGLHPDLFDVPGRGGYINSNPGASMLGAIPYAVARLPLETLYRLKPSLVAPKAPTTYADPRPNRTTFMNAMRARGLDVRLALAAAAIQLGLNVPLGALAAVLVFRFLRARLGQERQALWLALLYAFGTPMFFRSAFLNQNLIVAYCTLFAFLVLHWPRPDEAHVSRMGRTRVAASGALLGLAVLCDYSGVPLLVTFGLWLTILTARNEGIAQGIRSASHFAMGAAGPIAILFIYQYAAFGSPFLPAQAYMPNTTLSVGGWNGVSLPKLDLLWRNLIDPGYGLLVFCPMLIAAVFAPRYRREPDGLDGHALLLVFGATLALYLFSSSVAFAGLQWNTGVRYLVPAAPLLFLAMVPILLRLRPWGLWLLTVPTLTISWCVSMTRESVPSALHQVFTHGLELPWHIVLQKTASGYGSALSGPVVPIVVLLVTALCVWLIWRRTTVGHGVVGATAGADYSGLRNK